MCNALTTLLFSTLVAVLYAISGSVPTTSVKISETCICEEPAVVTHSTITPDSPLHKDVTLHCEVEFRNTTLSDRDTRVTLSKQPDRNSTSNISLRYRLSDDRYKIRIILVLANVTKQDQAAYALTLINICCSFSCPKMSLTVGYNCSSEIPKPAHPEGTVSVLNMSHMKLAANFSGDSDAAHYRIVWSNSSIFDLAMFGTSGKYLTKHKVISPCFFTEELIIHNVSVADAGLYTALVTGPTGFGANTSFIVPESDLTDENDTEIVPIYSSLISVGVFALTVSMVGICFFMYTRRKKCCLEYRLTTTPEQPPVCSSGEYPLGEHEERDHGAGHEHFETAAQKANQRNGVFFLYCKVDIKKETLLDLVDLLCMYSVHPHLDLSASMDPANWSIWTQTMIESYRHVIMICTRPLYEAFRGNLNNSLDRSMVEMHRGSFYADAIVNCIQPSKFIPVFIDSARDRSLVPMELRTHRHFQLNISHLMETTQGIRECVEKEINDNSDFVDFKQLIELLKRHSE